MSTHVDCVIVLSRQTPATEVSETLRRRIAESGGIFRHETTVIFNDFGEEEREPEFATSMDVAWASILSWPGLGGTSFAILGYQITIFLHGAAPGLVDFVTLSTSERAYSSDIAFRQGFDHLSADLHNLLHAKRTFSGFELLSPGSWVTDEVERVRRGVFEAQYELDLRR